MAERRHTDSLIVELEREIVDVRQRVEVLEGKIKKDNTAEIFIGGLAASISKEFWEKHGTKITLVLLAIVGLTGWGARLLELYKEIRK